MDKSEIRAIVEEHLPHLKQSLGLNHWVINVEYKKLDDDVSGECRARYPYHRADLKLDPAELHSRAAVLETLRHELLHVVLSPINILMDTAWDLVSGPEAESALKQAYRHANELSVNAVEYALDVGLGQTVKAISRRGERTIQRWNGAPRRSRSKAKRKK
jgi:hypothetical protein